MNEERVDCIDTFCGNCVFATYIDDGEGLVQDGCEANMLYRLAELGKECESVINPDNSVSVKILDTVCEYWRNIEWKVSKGIDEDIDVLVNIAREEQKLVCDIVVYCGQKNTFEELSKTLDSIKAMHPEYQFKIYFLNDGLSTPGKFLVWANERLQDIPWRAEFLLEETKDILRAVDAVSEKCTNRFIAFFRAGFIVPVDFLKCIDIALHDNLQRFVALSPIDDINGMLVSHRINKILCGNKHAPVLTQIKELCEEQQCHHMLRPVTEIVQSMGCAVE